MALQEGNSQQLEEEVVRAGRLGALLLRLKGADDIKVRWLTHYAEISSQESDVLHPVALRRESAVRDERDVVCPDWPPVGAFKEPALSFRAGPLA